MESTTQSFDDPQLSDAHEVKIQMDIKRKHRNRSILTSVGIMVAAALLGFGGAMFVDNVMSADSANTSTSTTSGSTTSLSNVLGTSLGQ